MRSIPVRCVLCLLAIFSFPGPLASETLREFGDKDNSKRILIVTDGSSFKNKVVNKIFALSDGKDAYYRVVEIKDIALANNEEYGRYMILCKMIGGNVERESFAFYQTLADKDAILIGLTYYFNMPMPENAMRDIGEIDAMTSASKSANVDAFARKIVDWLATDE